MIKRFTRNVVGRDIAVGDIHGHFTRLQQALDAIGFDPEVDRLFSVGDLIDRGPESGQVIQWLDRLHAVQGNHEDFAIQHVAVGVDFSLYTANGGAWFLALPKAEQEEIAVTLAELPIGIEVETSSGLVCLVHADCPLATWDAFRQELTGGGMGGEHIKAMALWSRARIESGDASGVPDVRAVVCGHTPLRSAGRLGNVFYIDTGGWLPDESGRFTFIDLNTLECIPPIPSLNWTEE